MLPTTKKNITPLLQVNHLKKYFSAQKAVDDVSFEIHRGEIFGLLGPNGAGKTTLIRMITGIILPDEGDILLEGVPFNIHNDIAKIGYMPEERGLYKKMKVEEHVVFLARLKGLSKKEAQEQTAYWFDKFQMQSWRHKKVADLSKGMSQKLQFITTVIHQPSLIILDEPFSGLDPVNANLIKDEIYQLARNGSTIIFSTHRMEQVEEICNNIILINTGTKILDGSVMEIKHKYKKNNYKLRLSHANIDYHSLPFECITQQENNIIVKGNEQYTGNQILQYFLEKDCIIHHFSEELPSLNEIFIYLVEGTQSVARPFQD